MPVSMTATLMFTEPLPFPASVLLVSASMRLMPVGKACAMARTSRSGDTKATRLSARIALSAVDGKVAAYPLSAWL